MVGRNHQKTRGPNWIRLAGSKAAAAIPMPATAALTNTTRRSSRRSHGCGIRGYHARHQLASNLSYAARDLLARAAASSDELFTVYLIHYVLSCFMAVTMAAIGTVFSEQCDATVLAFLTSFGYLNLICGLVSAGLNRYPGGCCELILIINTLANLLNHGILLYGVLVLFDGIEIKVLTTT